MKAKKIVLGRNEFITKGRQQLDHSKVGQPLSHKQKKALINFSKINKISKIRRIDPDTNENTYITIEDFIFISDMEYREDILSFQQLLDSFNHKAYV